MTLCQRHVSRYIFDSYWRNSSLIILIWYILSGTFCIGTFCLWYILSLYILSWYFLSLVHFDFVHFVSVHFFWYILSVVHFIWYILSGTFCLGTFCLDTRISAYFCSKMLEK